MGFASFLVRRILLGIVVLWFVTVATFLLFFVAPQDPARLLAGKNVSASQIANINRRLGLDQPLIVQYWHYLDRLLHGDLGPSYFTGTSVNTSLKQDLPPTLSLLVGGVVLWLMLGEDYIRTARSKGLSERRVLYRHGVRSALAPVVSQLGVDIGTLAGGAIVTETVFSLGGIGQASVTAITNGDAPVVLGVVLMAALFVVVANLIVDILYSLLDPRVKLA
jgi:ABC-type dipeptide/oligopeptide/nickel transport system permease component